MVSTVLASPDESKLSDGLSEEFSNLSRDTDWKKVEELDLDFNIHHPQGMAKIGDRFYISSVEIIEKPEKYEEPKDGYDRSAGKGVGHLFIVDEKGNLIEDLKLGEGDMYHPGGIAIDGKSIWVPVAEYRPDSKSLIYKINPESKKIEEAFEVDDHIGGVVSDEMNNKLYGVNWGSRDFYEWNENGKQKAIKENPSHFIDYQDCEGVDENNLLCSGIAELPNGDDVYELGGLALLDRKSKEIKHEIPITQRSPQNHTITRNPVFVEKTKDSLKLFAVPDDDQTSLLVYEAKLK
ncbi:DUF6454 family protein [Alkalihalobacillus sp. TS-13]|uniref:DUF6454 family protein n=1 Tax=Alkalihalobacillus sp. TS-13 TaxID=2842455 RepID=UPI001C88204E|nr:DUF6454 family protein [Alkalihalobacillus sp. TS-13]